MSSLLFYKKPIPLEKVKHVKLKLKQPQDLKFAEKANSVPVAGTEFFACSRNHPVMFVKNSDGGFVPIALLSFVSDGNNLGDHWEGVYIPAFVRRYPFVLEAEKGIVLFDEESPQLQEEEGERLFNDEGEATETLSNIVKFLDHVDRGFRATESYVKALVEKDLLHPCKNTIKFTDNTLKLDNLYVVDEKEFVEKLSDEEVVEWFKKGWIAWTYAHLNSVSSITEVVKRLPKKEAEPA